jgi:hypothetical protein
MPRHVVRPWSFEDLEQLRTLARKLPTRELAFRLERSPAAVTSKARQLRVSLKMKKSRKTVRRQNNDVGQVTGSDFERE